MIISFQPVAVGDPAATAEESAASGIVAIAANGHSLTEGVGFDSNALQAGPLVSAYPLAEWLSWNWWRLRWEPRPQSSPSPDWAFAHRLQSVGAGYLWPNIEIASDGVLVRLRSQASSETGARPFRYLGSERSETVSPADFHAAVWAFIHHVLSCLESSPRDRCSLRQLVTQTEQEMADPERERFRRIEAILGHDPNEGDEADIRRRLSEADVLGEQAVLEVAADGSTLGATELREDLRQFGFDSKPADAIALNAADIPEWGSDPAWRVGVALAQKLRHTEFPNGACISNCRLAELAGTQTRTLEKLDWATNRLSFEWRAEQGSQIALRSKWKTGRRFDLARLIADRLLPDPCPEPEPLAAATRSRTYRQKAQRAFATELLAPVDAVKAFLNGDLSEDHQTEAAEYFDVSPVAIHRLLMNNRLAERADAFEV